MSILIVVAGFSVTRVADYDLWWHMNLGRSVWQSMNPFVVDSFSWTFAGQPQYNGEWLADLAWFASYSIAGYPGVAFLKATLLMLAFYIFWQCCSLFTEEDTADARSRVIALTLTFFLVAFAIRFRMFPRPFLFSFVFMGAFIYLIGIYRQSSSVKILIAMPLLVLLWANTSKASVYAPVIFAMFILESFFKRTFDRKLLVALVSIFIVSLINPDSIRRYMDLFPFFFGGAERIAVVGEQKPLSIPMLWGFGIRYTWGYQLLVLFSVGYLTLLKGWRSCFLLLLFLFFFFQSLLMVRMIDFFSLVASLTVFPALLSIVSRIQSGAFRAISANSFAVIALLTGMVSIAWSETYQFGVQPKKSHVPDGALEFLEREKIQGKLFNSFPYGGYINWKYPGRKVFMDGRINQLFPPQFHKRYMKIIHNDADWRTAEAEYGFDHALLEYDLKSFALHMPKHLADNSGWALVYWDDHSAVYLKKDGRFDKIISDKAYKIVRPSLNDFGYIDASLKKSADKKLVLDQIEHDITLNPNNQEPRLARVFALYYLNDPASRPEIIKELEQCLKLEPDIAMEHSALALLLMEKGNRESALVETKKALALDPYDNAGRHLGKKFGLKLVKIEEE